MVDLNRFATVMTLLNRCLALGLVFSLSVVTPSFAEKTRSDPVIRPLPPSGEFVYVAMHGNNGFKLGEARYSWRRDHEKYAMLLKLKTTGLMDRIYHFEYTQESRGRVSKEGLLPDFFQVSQKGRGDETATFDRSAKKITMMRKGKKSKYALEKGVQDVLSVWQAASLTGVDALIGERMIVTNRRVYSAHVVLGEVEQQQLPVGNVLAQHLLITGEGSHPLRLDLWLSPVYYNMPVRIMMTDHRDNKVDLRLKAVNGLSYE